MEKWIFKILRPEEWQTAQSNNAFAGAPIDVLDGYVHFSTASQLQETADKYFVDTEEIYVLAFSSDTWPTINLKWEPSRGGALFPHLYAPLNVSLHKYLWKLPKSASDTFDLNNIHEWTANHA